MGNNVCPRCGAVNGAGAQHDCRPPYPNPGTRPYAYWDEQLGTYEPGTDDHAPGTEPVE